MVWVSWFIVFTTIGRPSHTMWQQVLASRCATWKLTIIEQTSQHMVTVLVSTKVPNDKMKYLDTLWHNRFDVHALKISSNQQFWLHCSHLINHLQRKPAFSSEQNCFHQTYTEILSCNFENIAIWHYSGVVLQYRNDSGVNTFCITKLWQHNRVLCSFPFVFRLLRICCPLEMKS